MAATSCWGNIFLHFEKSGAFARLAGNFRLENVFGGEDLDVVGTDTPALVAKFPQRRGSETVPDEVGDAHLLVRRTAAGHRLYA